MNSLFVALIALSASIPSLGQCMDPRDFNSFQWIEREAERFRLKGVREADLPYIRQHPNSDRVVVLFHGISSSPDRLRSVAEIFFSEGFSVVSPLYEYHGQGRAELLHMEPSSMRVQARRSLQAAREMGDKIVLFGYSLGTLFPIELALGNRRSSDLRALMIAAPFFKHHHPLAAASGLAAWTGKWIEPFRYYDEDLPFHAIAVSRRHAIGLRELLNQNHPIELPTFFFVNPSDDIVSNRTTERMLGRFLNGKMIELAEGVPHGQMFESETYPAEFSIFEAHLRNSIREILSD